VCDLETFECVCEAIPSELKHYKTIFSRKNVAYVSALSACPIPNDLVLGIMYLLHLSAGIKKTMQSSGNIKIIAAANRIFSIKSNKNHHHDAVRTLPRRYTSND